MKTLTTGNATRLRMAPCLLSHQTVPQGFVFHVLLIIVDWIKLRVRFVLFALR